MIARRGVLTFVVQVTQVAALVGVNVIVTRVTGASGKGIFTLMSLLVTLGTAVTALGINWAAIYFLGRRQFTSRDIAPTLLACSLVSAVVTDIGLVIGYVAFRHSYFEAVSVAQLAVTLAIVPAAMLTTTFGSMILGGNRPIEFAMVTLAQWVLTLVIQAGLALAGQLDPTSALAAWLVGSVASVVFGAGLLGSGIRWRLGFDRGAFRDLLNFGVKGYLANLLQFFNYRLDSLIVNALSGIASVGVYSISVAMGEVIWYVAQAFGTVMFPHVSSVDRREADRVTPIVSRNVWFLTLLGVVFVAITGRWIIGLVFGPAMTGAGTPLLLLLPGILALSGTKILSSYLSGIGRPIYATYIAAANVVLTVILDLVLIPRFGIAGAAAASSIVYTITSIAVVVVFRKESGARIVETIVIQPQDLNYYVRAARSVAGVFGAPSPAKP